MEAAVRVAARVVARVAVEMVAAKVVAMKAAKVAVVTVAAAKELVDLGMEEVVVRVEDVEVEAQAVVELATVAGEEKAQARAEVANADRRTGSPAIQRTRPPAASDAVARLIFLKRVWVHGRERPKSLLRGAGYSKVLLYAPLSDEDCSGPRSTHKSGNRDGLACADR